MSWKRHLMLGTVLPVATLAWPGSAPGRVLLGEPDVDRASDQYDGNWCPAENHSFFGTFTADGPEVTLVIHATNWWSGIFRNEHIDNVFVTPLADYNAALHEADSTVIANYFCVFDSTDYFHFDELAQGAAIFEDRFVSGPDPRWDLTEASFNPATSGLNALVFPLDDTGGSLSLGDVNDPNDPTYTTEITIDGFTNGQQYVVSLWTVGGPIVGPDTEVEIYGMEFFRDVTAVPLFTTAATRGIAWGDYDGDSDDDLYVANFSDGNFLLRNDGGGVFTDVSNAVTGDANRGTGVVWVDSDNDADLDLYLANAGDRNVWFRNDGGNLVNASFWPIDDAGLSTCASWSDHDLDGDVDLTVGDETSGAKLFRNDGPGSFVDVTPSVFPASGHVTSAAWADADDDGDPDVYLVLKGQANRLIRNDGANGFSFTPSSLGDTGDGTSAAWGDWDNDQDLDVILTNETSWDVIYRNDGGLSFAAIPLTVIPTSDGSEAMWLDYDNDADLDAYVGSKSGHANVLWRNDGGTFVQHFTGTVEVPFETWGVAGSDVDADGDVDLYLSDGVDDNLLFRNEIGDENHWFQIDLVGTISNRSAVGARVDLVTSAGVTQTREVSCGGGRESHDSLTLEFGLGFADQVTSIDVRWPSGIQQSLSGLAANQRITIVEQNPSSVAVSPLSIPFTLQPNAPNPFPRSTTIAYTLGESGPVQLHIYDITGRLVRTLVDESRGAGPHRVSWDGYDETGSPAAGGVYFYELRSGAFQQTRKMVLVPDGY